MKRDLKCIIWDLDDTIWSGCLAENQQITIRKNILELIENGDSRGIINSVCSKNDFQSAKAKLVEWGVWDYFVFPVIEFGAKGENVRRIVEDLQLRFENVLFIDDNISNRKEVEYYCRNIMTCDINNERDLVQLKEYIDSATGKSRLTRYRILEAKSIKKREYSDNALFLKDSDIAVCIIRNPMDLNFKERIFELGNRTNQLNFTKSRFHDMEQLDTYLEGGDSIYKNHGVVFAYDRYGVYGLVGFYSFDERLRHPILEHFFFSCRIMNMGIEQAVIAYLNAEFSVLPPADGIRHDWLGRDTSYIRILHSFDSRLKGHYVSEEGTSLIAKTSIVAGCTSGVIGHYLSDSFRPVRFDDAGILSGNVVKDVDQLIYTVYTEYVDVYWAEQGGFSLQKFGAALEKFIRDHKGIEIYLILASENRKAMLRNATHLSRIKIILKTAYNGDSHHRMKACNRVVKEVAKKYPGVHIVQVDSFIRDYSEQLNYRHFSRVVFERIAQYIESESRKCHCARASQRCDLAGLPSQQP